MPDLPCVWVYEVRVAGGTGVSACRMNEHRHGGLYYFRLGSIGVSACHTENIQIRLCWGEKRSKMEGGGEIVRLFSNDNNHNNNAEGQRICENQNGII